MQITVFSFFNCVFVFVKWLKQTVVATCNSNPFGKEHVCPHIMGVGENHLFHWTKKPFSLVNVLPLTGELMGLDHVHLRTAVNVITHM